MFQSQEANNALWMLNGIENGTCDSAEAYKAGADIDPVYLCFIFRYLREKYPPTHPHAQGVMERLLDLTTTYTDLVANAQKGEKDPITSWFNDAYSIRDYFNDPEQLISMIMDKIEG